MSDEDSPPHNERRIKNPGSELTSERLFMPNDVTGLFIINLISWNMFSHLFLFHFYFSSLSLPSSQIYSGLQPSISRANMR